MYVYACIGYIRERGSAWRVCPVMRRKANRLEERANEEGLKKKEGTGEERRVRAREKV